MYTIWFELIIWYGIILYNVDLGIYVTLTITSKHNAEIGWYQNVGYQLTNCNGIQNSIQNIDLSYTTMWQWYNTVPHAACAQKSCGYNAHVSSWFKFLELFSHALILDTMNKSWKMHVEVLH